MNNYMTGSTIMAVVLLSFFHLDDISCVKMVQPIVLRLSLHPHLLHGVPNHLRLHIRQTTPPDQASIESR